MKRKWGVPHFDGLNFAFAGELPCDNVGCRDFSTTEAVDSGATDVSTIFTVSRSPNLDDRRRRAAIGDTSGRRRLQQKTRGPIAYCRPGFSESSYKSVVIPQHCVSHCSQAAEK